MAYLADATFMRHRIGQRVTQALGRANRRPNDWAMYLGLAPRFGTLLSQSAVRQAIPPDVRPLIDDALHNMQSGWVGAYQAARDFWDSNGQQPPAGAGSIGAQRHRPGRVRPAATASSASDEVTSVTQLWLGGPIAASEAAGRAATSLLSGGEVEHAAFWSYVQAQAHYEEGTPASIGRAIEALRKASQGGALTAWFVRLGRVLADLRGEQVAAAEEQPWLTWDDWIAEAGPSGVTRSISRCHERLKGTHDERAEGLELLGRTIGVNATRLTGQGVTDTIWSWAGPHQVERCWWAGIVLSSEHE